MAIAAGSGAYVGQPGASSTSPAPSIKFYRRPQVSSGHELTPQLGELETRAIEAQPDFLSLIVARLGGSGEWVSAEEIVNDDAPV